MAKTVWQRKVLRKDLDQGDGPMGFNALLVDPRRPILLNRVNCTNVLIVDIKCR